MPNRMIVYETLISMHHNKPRKRDYLFEYQTHWQRITRSDPYHKTCSMKAYKHSKKQEKKELVLLLYDCSLYTFTKRQYSVLSV